MGLRIFIGAIIAVLLGGTGYFAQQSLTTKNLLQQREAELSKEKESSAKLRSGILRFKNLEQKVKGLESRFENVNASAKTRLEKLNKLVTEKNTAIEQNKAKILSLATALEKNQTTLDNERKARAEEVKDLEAQAKQANRLIAEKSTSIKQEKAKIRNLKVTLDILSGSLDNERKARVGLEKVNKQNIELLTARAEEIKGLEAQFKETSRLIAEKNTAIEQEKAKARQLEITLKQIQTNFNGDRKTQAMVENLTKQSIELATAQVKEIKRLERFQGSLEAQLQKVDSLIASAQQKANERKSNEKTAKVNTQDAMLAKNQAEELKRLQNSRALLKAQVQEMGRLISEKNVGIAREKTKAKNLQLALNQIRVTLHNEQKTRVKTEKENARNAELARTRAESIRSLTKARELQQAQIQEMSQLIAEKTSVAELIKNKLNQTNLSLAETIKKHTLAIARSKVLEKRAREEAERAKRLEADLSELDAKLKKQTVNLEQTRDQLRVTIVNSLLFDSGSATLKDKSFETLSNIADFLQKQKDKMIRIEGHTDDQPIKSELLVRYPSNWELSFARAVSIVKFLESKNISPARMSATGHSYYRPVAGNDSEEGRAKNRRTVILLSSPRPAGEEASR